MWRLAALTVDLRGLRDRNRSGGIVPPGLRDRRDRDRHHRTVSPPAPADYDYDATSFANSDDPDGANLDPTRATYAHAAPDAYGSAGPTQSDPHAAALADGHAGSADADDGGGTQAQPGLSS